jgi:hypothetical protein
MTTVRRYDPADFRLGRHVVHDERSRSFVSRETVDRSLWRDKAVRIYDPYPNPDQCHGECTFVAKAMQLNAVGNRVTGRVLKMDTVHKGYALATTLDPFPGTFLENGSGEDTGSSGLASAKAAILLGLGGEYRWQFNADEVIEQVMRGRVVSVGTRWDYNMFHQDHQGRITPGGGEAGGHQWVVRGYDRDRDWAMGRCWWGEYRDFWISRPHLQELLEDFGDAHVQDVIA